MEHLLRCNASLVKKEKGHVVVVQCGNSGKPEQFWTVRSWWESYCAAAWAGCSYRAAQKCPCVPWPYVPFIGTESPFW